MNYLKQKVDLINSFISDIEEYINKLSPLISENMPDKISKINELHNNIKHILSKKEDDEIKLLGITEDAKLNFDSINLIFSKIHKNKNSYSSSLSDTYKNEVFRMFDTLSLKYIRIKSQITKIDNDIIDYIGNIKISEIKIASDKLEEFKKFRKLFHADNNLINLYIYVTKKILKYFKNEDRNLIFSIYDLLEEDKDIVLNVGETSKKKIKKNPMLKTFGLVANGEFLNPKEISNKWFSRKISKNIFEELSKKENLCIIILKKITNLPIIFDINKLIKKNYENKEVIENLGVNKEIVDKYKTIQFIEKAKNWDFSIKVYGDIKLEKILILETFNEVVYRNLNLWPKTTSYVMPRNILVNFLNYVQLFNSNNLHSTRIDIYNENLSEQILENIYFSKKINLFSLTEESGEMNARYLRSIMISMMKDIFIKKAKSIKNNSDLEKLIKDQVFIDKFGEILIEYYEQYKSEKILTRHNFEIGEILTDFVYQLNELNKQFAKEMQFNYNETKIDKESYKNSLKIFEDILMKSLKVIVIDNKNLYQSMLFKDKLLSI